jgi:glycosyltransferase involved in cell wall biosynthesis
MGSFNGRFQPGPWSFLLKQQFKRNTSFRKTRSSGRDLVVYCGDRRGCSDRKLQWNPAVFATRGLSGSEEAIINLSRELAKLGWDVTVYNNCGHKPAVDAGVTYRPVWEFNPRDRQDVLILWRCTEPIDWDPHVGKIFIDLHDFMEEEAFVVRNRIQRITRIFAKSRFQRSLFPSLPEEKFAVVPNGIDVTLLDATTTKDRYLLINTSSPDRSLDVLPKLFTEVRRRVPQARLQWAYGWGSFELARGTSAEAMRWMRHTRRAMDDARIETMGQLTPVQVAALYQRAAIFAYPTEFHEMGCISVRKAQACGCVPVTTDFGDLAESVQFGVKLPFQVPDLRQEKGRAYFGLQDRALQRSWIDAVVDLLTNQEKREALAIQGTDWARQFGWPQIAAQWHNILCN